MTSEESGVEGRGGAVCGGSAIINLGGGSLIGGPGDGSSRAGDVTGRDYGKYRWCCIQDGFTDLI